MAGWAVNAGTKIGKLREELETLPASQDAAKKRMQSTLDDVEDELRLPNRLKSVLLANGAQKVWGAIHTVEEVLLSLEQDPSRAEDRAIRCGRSSLSSRRVEVCKREFDKATAAADKLRLARNFQAEAHGAAQDRHNSERNKQRGMLIICVVLLAIAGVVAILQANSRSSFLPSPEDGSVSGFTLLSLVMFFGLLGGLLSGFVNLYIRPTRLDHTQWFDIKPVSMCVNAAFGLWTSFIGVMAVGTGLIVGKYLSLPAVLLLALIFGYGQQAVAKLLERKASDIIEATK
ncbi:hypothetical protein [Pseudarthrobacter sulfonivorans]|uniref:hypothetical protein n=1 Tax=Pseudarthrobacter sulfonivorans TaxID=121292 RepID=UPI002855D8D6|nr:hypothetical protein [Pseudarthrobacter sulfonivorans]MDR6414064.1 hypothetical protein [Pseudarthrobacter sulfonivorans]